MKTLIVFFSRAGENYFNDGYRYVDTGNTEIAARQVKKLTGADSFRIRMKKEYAADYSTCIKQAKDDQKSGRRPELAEEPADIAKYDNIILMYPNYWGTCPMVVIGFLEKYDFAGKTIFPICTHEGSGMGNSKQDISEAAEGANVAEGLPIRGSDVRRSENEIEKWIRKNGLI